jgi:hypothetical protein
MAAIRMPMTKLPAQRKEYMPKTITIDHTSVLEMALVGYELQRDRIEAAIAEIQAQLGDGGSGRSSSTATTIAEPKATGKKRFSAAARKRMAAAQKKRWQLKRATAKKTQPAAPVKGQKATTAAPARKQPVQVKAAKKVAPKPKAKTTAPRPKVQHAAVETPKIVNETPAPDVAATEPATEAATA